MNKETTIKATAIVIDELIHHNLRYYYNKIGNREDMEYFCGLLEASYQFVYYLIDNSTQTITDAILMLDDEKEWYANKNTYFAHGYVKGIDKLIAALNRQASPKILDEMTINDFKF